MSCSSMRQAAAKRPPMLRKLYEAAFEGNKQVLIEMLGLEEDGDHITLPIESLTEDERSENLQSATFMGNTVLHVLCAYDHDDLASMVCKKDGSLLRACNKLCETPLHYAAKGIVNEKAMDVLMEFARSKGEGILKEVLRDRNRHGETALHVVATYHKEKVTTFNIVQKMMNGDLEWADQVDNNGLSSLDLAIDRGHAEIRYYMIHQVRDNRYLSKTRCHEVTEPTKIHANISSAEKAQKERPKSVGIFGSYPIHTAASLDDWGAADLLLAKDVSLAYLQDSDGLFPVHVAARMGNTDTIRSFILKCPDPCELVDDRERNYLHIAAEENLSHVFSILLLKETYNDDYLFTFRDASLKRMLRTTDKDGNTPMHIASEKGNKSLMKIIYDWEKKSKCGSYDIRNRKGLSAFDISKTEVRTRMKNSPETEDSIQKFRLREINSDHPYHRDFSEGWFDDVMSAAEGTEDSIQKFRLREINSDHPYHRDFSEGWFDDVMSAAEGNYESRMMNQLQIIGLGAVLITTVAFAVAFTLPGGYDSNGSPLLAGKYLFMAFILAVTSAFLQSFFCVLILIFGGLCSIDSFGKSVFLSIAMYLFSGGARSMVLSFGLGLYLVLAPVNKGVSIFILLLAVASVMLDITPNVARFIIKEINKIGAIKEDSKTKLKYIFLGWTRNANWRSVKEYFKENPWFMTRMLRFVLPFVFIFILALLP